MRQDVNNLSTAINRNQISYYFTFIVFNYFSFNPVNFPHLSFYRQNTLFDKNLKFYLVTNTKTYSFN